MKDKFAGENWKELTFDFEYTNNLVIEVSSFGRVRSFNKINTGKILNTSLINGYPVLKLKFYKARDPKVEVKLKNLMSQVPKLVKKIKELNLNPKDNKQEIIEKTALLNTLKLKITAQSKQDLKLRAINYSTLVHRAVATLFCKKESEYQNIVSHLDYNKENNKIHNLKWMTKEENLQHQKANPLLIELNEAREKMSSNAGKLSVTRVMLLKKMLAEGKPTAYLVKTFKVSETQILRIKKGENWKNVPAAN